MRELSANESFRLFGVPLLLIINRYLDTITAHVKYGATVCCILLLIFNWFLYNIAIDQQCADSRYIQHLGICENGETIWLQIQNAGIEWCGHSIENLKKIKIRFLFFNSLTVRAITKPWICIVDIISRRQNQIHSLPFTSCLHFFVFIFIDTIS